jgi:hypothetical protein
MRGHLSMSDKSHADATRGRNPGLACRCCGEPIGVYEPLIAIERGRPRRTSRAAEPTLVRTPGEYRHADCHKRYTEPSPRAPPEVCESVLAG